MLTEAWNKWIEEETELEAQMLIENLEWGDLLSYHEPSFIPHLIAYLQEKGITINLRNFLDDSEEWIYEALVYRSPGFPHAPESEFCLLSIGEIEVTPPVKVTSEKAREWINDNTDLYLADFDNAYINTGYDNISIDYALIDFEEYQI